MGGQPAPGGRRGQRDPAAAGRGKRGGGPAVAPIDRDLDHLANLLGALGLMVADRMAEAIASGAGQSGSGAAALSAMEYIAPHPSIDTLRRVTGLTSSGAVRLVDGLVEQGLAVRGPGQDGRTTTVTLTHAGHAAARAVSRVRLDLLAGMLRALEPRDRAVLESILGRLLVAAMRPPGATRWTCRMCDTGACGRYDGRCPIGNEAIARYGAVAAGRGPT